MKKNKGKILNIIASIGRGILQPFCWTWGIIEASSKGELDQWEYDKAEMKDRWGNILIKYPANRILITQELHSYKFGQKPDTISKVLGINKLRGTLTKQGLRLADYLNKIEPNHVENAIDK